MNRSIFALMLISMSLSVAVAEPSNPIQLSAEEMDLVSAGMGGCLASSCAGLALPGLSVLFSSPVGSYQFPPSFFPTVEDPPLPPVENY